MTYRPHVTFMLSALFPNIVRDLPLFADIPYLERVALLQSGSLRRCPQGQMLFVHNDPVTHFYVILSGTMQLFRETLGGHEKTVDILKAGQTMCESEIMDSSCHAHRVNCVAVDNAVLMEFPAAWLKQAVRTNSALALNLLSSISQQAHLSEVEAEQQASMSAAQLVASFLQRLCVTYDFDPKGFVLPYNKSLIASRLGMALETFSRTLAKLKEHGVTVDGTHVVIDDLKHIDQYVSAASVRCS